MKINKIFLALAVFGFLFVAASALAAAGDYVPLVKIPGIPAGADFLQYLKGIYNFLISIVGILAMAALVYGGFRYLTSVGNPAAVEDAKDIINSAIIGLVLALSSWLILNEINPDVLTIKKPGQIGALPGKYAYNPGPARDCFTNIQNSNSGTSEKYPCECADGTKQYYDKTSTTLAFSLSPTNPPPLAPTGNITFSGKLTDASGKGIAGQTIEIRTVNDSLSAWDTFTLTTDPNGDFSDTRVTHCSSTDTVQAVFDKTATNPTYLPSVSAPITLTYGGGPACAKAVDYNNLPASPPSTKILPTNFCQWMCSDPAVPKDKKNHCGWKFVRLTMDSSSTKNGDYYILKPDNELWEFFLTNETDYGWGDFNIKATSYTNGTNTYDCAILLTEEITNAPDGLCVYWVKKGVEIRADGSSLQKDIEVSGKKNIGPGPYFDQSCNPAAVGAFGTNAGNCTCGAIVVWTNGIEDVWQAHYTDNPISDRCGNCSFSVSNTQYRPNKTIICSESANGDGVWRIK